jgi:LmbE family N-acetylglucosaminyl deacetylase
VFARLKNFMQRVEMIIWSRKAYRFHMQEWRRLTDLDGAAQLLNTVRFSRTLVPLEMEPPAGRRITVIAPHPDDEAIGPGGTLLLAMDRGCKVTIIFVTSGGEHDDDVRVRESQDVCESQGWDAVHLKLPAGSMNVDNGAATQLAAAIKDSRPDIVMLPYVLDDHDDHRRVNQLWLASRGGGIADVEVWAYQVYSVVLANIVVDITQVRQQKVDLIRRYSCQMTRRDWSNFALGRDAWTSRWLVGRKTAAWAEAFHVVPAKEYLDQIAVYFKDNQNPYYR